MNKLLEVWRQSPHWSYSALSKFLNCPLAYYFQYVARRKPEHTPVNLVFGSAFHAAATVVAVGQMDGEPESVESAMDCFSDYWKTLAGEAENPRFKDGEDAEMLHELGRKMIAVLHASLQGEMVLAVAQAFRVPLLDDDGQFISDRPLVGEFDLVVDSPAGPVVVDWKTAARQWPADKASKDLQATAFSYAWSVQHGVDPGFRFDVVTKAKTPIIASHPTVRQADDYRRFLRLIAEVERAITAEVFLPNEQSFCCADCVHGQACANWHRAEDHVVLPTLFGDAA